MSWKDKSVEEHLSQNNEEIDRIVNTQRDEVILHIEEILLNKRDEYTSDPIMYIRLESLLHQLLIKATRALLAKNKDKLLDELYDCACYSILIIRKIKNTGD